ncbi:MAG: SPOR domain-containing protein [Candidatus Cloacimonetes bacterium]|nr:SPOR domain-containing protein [Candidatus Cloacimonadota bacterium]
MFKTLSYIAIAMTIIMTILLGCDKENKSKTVFTESENEQIFQEKTKLETLEIPQQTEEVIEQNVVDKDYEVQILASKNLEKLLQEKRKFAKFGYNFKVSKKNVNGETYYRLRLAGNFTHKDAVKIANSFKEEFNQTQKIWVQKTK